MILAAQGRASADERAGGLVRDGPVQGIRALSRAFRDILIVLPSESELGSRYECIMHAERISD